MFFVSYKAKPSGTASRMREEETMMDQAEYRVQGVEVREVELVLLATPG